jgi:phytoene dehydrogenase-like protein
MTSLIPPRLKAALCFVGLLSISHATPILDERGFAPQDIITRDVCIIGGGATGTYSAVRLSQDLGKSVVVVEKTDRLGGHTETYIDPVTHYPVDYGVLAYHNLTVVTEFFARFGVSLTTVPITSPFTTEYVDLSTGKVVPRRLIPPQRWVYWQLSSRNTHTSQKGTIFQIQCPRIFSFHLATL